MDLLEQASDWLERQRTRFATKVASYQRGDASVSLATTIGKTVVETTGEYGVVEKIESRDYLVLAEALVLEGQRILPERGDRICETEGDVAIVYEVMAPGHEPPWRYSDPFRKTLRIHTKHVDTESP